MRVNSDSTIPIFMQIADLIEDQILNGVLDEDDQVYSTNELATLLKVNPATARKGLTILVDKNVLYKKRGLGMFVKEGARAMIRQSRLDDFVSTYVSQLLKEGEKLGVDKEAIVKMILSYKEGEINE